MKHKFYDETVILGELTREQLEKENFALVKPMCGWYYISRSQTMEEKRRYNGDLSGVTNYANQGCPTCDGEPRTAERNNCQAYFEVKVGYRKLESCRPFNIYEKEVKNNE